MKYKIQFILVFLLCFSHAIKSQNYSFKKIPKWVKPIEVTTNSSISKYDILTGFYLTLADYQVNLKENAIFSHEVIDIVSYGGITNASQIAVSLDTAYQKLQIHHLYIWRKGIKIDRTNDLTMETMRNENSLQQGIYTGQIVIYDILNDIRKDDLIDFAYTIIGNNPIFDNEKYLFVALESTNPVDLLSVRLIYPKEEDYTFECSDCDSLVTVSEDKDFKQIEFKNVNIKAIKLEDDLPPWSIPYKYLMLSSLKSWNDVHTWAQNVFALKKEPDLADVFTEIFTGKESTDEKINKIINFVQDDIRYMGVESGIGSVKPHAPDQVVKQRYGDCKDKSLLLVSLLKKIGINQAYPVLVNTAMQHEIGKLGPSNQIFNHCIVTFNYNDSSYWVDPSIPMQGGNFRNINNTNFGKVLIIGLPSDSLQTMNVQKTNTLAEIVDEYTMSSFTKPATLKVTSTRYGLEADTRRSMVEYYTTSLLLEETLKELKLQYPIASKTSELEVTDDVENNKFSLVYNFEVDGFWQDGDKGTYQDTKGLWIFRYEPVYLYQYISQTASEEREFDCAIQYPVNYKYRVIFHLPKDIMINDDYESYDNDAFFYEEKLEQLNSNSFQIEYKFGTKSNYIKAEDYKEMCDQINTIAKKLPMIIYFTK